MSAAPAPRLGVFGGTFDPPHLGHLVAALNAAHALSLDRVLLVVAGVPWQKVDDRRISPAPDRLAMVEAAVAPHAGLEASDVEIQRGGPSYTADTLATLGADHPGTELWVVVGRDAAVGLPTWERVDEVTRRARLAVVDRPGSDHLVLPPDLDWTRVEIPRLDISSSDLRRRVRDGRPLDLLVPDPVIACIDRLGLYRGGPS